MKRKEETNFRNLLTDYLFDLRKLNKAEKKLIDELKNNNSAKAILLEYYHKLASKIS